MHTKEKTNEEINQWLEKLNAERNHKESQELNGKRGK